MKRGCAITIEDVKNSIFLGDVRDSFVPGDAFLGFFYIREKVRRSQTVNI